MLTEKVNGNSYWISTSVKPDAIWYYNDLWVFGSIDNLGTNNGIQFISKFNEKCPNDVVSQLVYAERNLQIKCVLDHK